MPSYINVIYGTLSPMETVAFHWNHTCSFDVGFPAAKHSLSVLFLVSRLCLVIGMTNGCIDITPLNFYIHEDNIWHDFKGWQLARVRHERREKKHSGAWCLSTMLHLKVKPHRERERHTHAQTHTHSRKLPSKVFITAFQLFHDLIRGN